MLLFNPGPSLQLINQSQVPPPTPSLQLSLLPPGSLKKPNTLLSLDLGSPASSGMGLSCAWRPCSDFPQKLREPCPISQQDSSLPLFKPLRWILAVHSHNVRRCGLSLPRLGALRFVYSMISRMPNPELGARDAPVNKTPALTLETYCIVQDRDQ